MRLTKRKRGSWSNQTLMVSDVRPDVLTTSVIPSEVEGSRCAAFKVPSRDSSTPLRSAQNDKMVFPRPRSIRPIRFAPKIDIVFFASRSDTMATIPIPMLKT